MTVDETPGSNRQGRATRRALIDAGWNRVDQLGLVDLFDSLRPGRVAARAGRSAGAFRHHFPSVALLVEALMEDLVGAAVRVGTETLTDPTEPGGSDLVSHVRRDATGVLEPEHPLAPTERRIGLVISRVNDEMALDVAKREMRGRIDGLAVSAEQIMDKFGRQPIPPLTVDEILAVSAAVTFGLLTRRAAEPALVPDTLMADSWMVETFAFTRAADSTHSVSDSLVELRPRSEAEPGPVGQDHEPELSPVLELFGREWERGSLSELASVLGQSVDDVRTRFGTVRRAAAESFGGCLDDVKAASTRHRERDPRRAVFDVFVELARWAGASPGAARALMEERSDARATGVTFGAVPLDEIATDALRVALADEEGAAAEVDDAGLAVRASAAVDVVLVVASTRDRMSPVAVARVALCALDDVLPLR